MKTRLKICIFTGTVAMAASASATILPIDLLGKGGSGLLASNENAAIVGTSGSGGELGTGILFNDVTLELAINVGWGSGNGFTDLTGDAAAGHLHGPTTSSGTASFTENAAVMIPLDSLPGFTGSATNGGFNGSVTLTAAQTAFLNDGRLYINFHTSANPGGEIRGSLVVVPEPECSACSRLEAQPCWECAGGAANSGPWAPVDRRECFAALPGVGGPRVRYGRPTG